jgi:hypothetical protein
MSKAFLHIGLGFASDRHETRLKIHVVVVVVVVVVVLGSLLMFTKRTLGGAHYQLVFEVPI